MRKLIVNKKYDGKYLNRFILDSFPNLSSNQLYKALRKKDIRINGIKVSENAILHTGDEITIYIVDSILDNIPTIPIIYEDENILVVNKPAGIPVTETSNSTIFLTSILKKQLSNLNFLEPCHRIDLNTKGLVIFAKTSKALTRLNEMFRTSEVKKTYWAVVKNAPQEPEGELVHFLVRNEKQNKSYAYDKEVPNSKKAILHYRLIGHSENYYLLEVDLKTGRHHQIRCQLAKMGCPIKGDLKYGSPRSNPDGSICLHARRVRFIHPVSKELIELEAPLPEGNLWKGFAID